MVITPNESLNQNGDVTLNGGLKIESIYTINTDDEFIILTWNGELNGTFDKIVTPALEKSRLVFWLIIFTR